MTKLPKISGVRSAGKTQFTITLLNFEAGDEWNVYQATRFADLVKVVDGHLTNEVTIPDLSETGNYTFFVTLNNAPLSASVSLVSNHTDEEDSYIVVHAIGSASIDVSSDTFEAPWLASDLENVPVSIITNQVIEWLFSNPLMTFGKNQTL